MRDSWGCVTHEWAADLVNLVHALRQFARGHTPGLYEILEYDTTLEVKDRRGKRAVFRKHQRVKFLQNNVIAFQDYVWGDGEIFADYRCKPGVVVDRYQEGDRWNILVSLRATKQRGHVEDFYIDRTVRNGFVNEEEWRQMPKCGSKFRLLKMIRLYQSCARILEWRYKTERACAIWKKATGS